MTDWADQEAGNLVVRGLGRATAHNAVSIASALRAAHKRGRIEGLREADVLAAKAFSAGRCGAWEIGELIEELEKN